jgi:hypothetical protein
MTKLFAKAIERVQQLPADLQDAAAAHLLADLDGELRWDPTLDETGESLATLADEAVSEYRAGRTKPLDPNAL